MQLDTLTWRIPAARRKLRVAKLDPLTPDYTALLAVHAVALPRELQLISLGSECLFSNVKRWMQPISENTINTALPLQPDEILG
jgi:hypothetical protein